MPRAIHQFVAGYSLGDAISNETRVMRDIFRKWGFESKIYCEHDRIQIDLRKECFDARECAHQFNMDDVVLLHLSIGSNVNEVFKRITCHKALLYHNITPSHFFKYLNPAIARHLDWGREQMKRLAGITEINMADSGYNAAELEAAGYGPVTVLPLVLDLAKLDEKPQRSALKGYTDDTATVLFVGRCAPNKAVHDLLYAFHYFQNYVEPNSRLIHVGSSGGVEDYLVLMHTLAADLQLKKVHFMGGVKQNVLNAYYKTADLFLCTSEHEGFGIPLIEAMYMDLPVLAYDCSAVPETMDGAGVLFREKNWDEVAEMMGQLVHNQPLRQAVLEGQRKRIDRYTHRDLEAELRVQLAPVLGG